MPNSIHWTTKEDERLRQLVCKHGDRKWSTISEELCTNKGSKQCRRRWKNCLSLNVKKGSWSEEEDGILLKAHEVHGNRWTLIAKMVGGRTDNAVKNRWAALNRRKITYPGRRPKTRRSFTGRTGLRNPTEFFVERKGEAGTMCGSKTPVGSVCPELQFNSLKSGDQRQSMTSRCQIPKLVDTRSMFDAQATKGFLGGDYSIPISASTNGRGNPAHDMENMSFGSTITSYGSLLEDLAIRPLGYGYEPCLVPNRDRIAHTRPPCFTHSELDMLLAALQGCRP